MRFASLMAVSLALFIAASGVAAEDKPNPDSAKAGGDGKPNRLFEMRIYTAHPGKLDALHQRFRDHTNGLFQKHGMELVAYWTPVEGEEAQSTLVYVLAYPDRESRDKSWKAFLDDSDWKKAYADSHKDGPLVMKVESKFLAPTDYSPIK